MKPILVRAAVVAALSVAASLVISTLLMWATFGRVHPVGLAIATLTPIIVSFPVTFVIERQRSRAKQALQDLSVAHQMLREMHEELASRARLDALTGIMNREYFLISLTNRLDEGQQGALLVIDADRFKLINDTHGHPTGDRALKVLADAVRSVLDDDCLFGRLGGEEFVVFIPHADRRSPSELAEACRKTVEVADFRLDNGKAYPLTVSIGGALAGHAKTAHDVINEADQNMYQAKKLGRNRVVMDQPHLAAIGS